MNTKPARGRAPPRNLLRLEPAPEIGAEPAPEPVLELCSGTCFDPPWYRQLR